MSELVNATLGPETKRSLYRGAIAGAIGNAMEWYDFTVYGFFAATIGALFFPSQNHFMSLLASFAAFAVGFVVRPFGALIFGHIGDKFGRRAALWTSVVCMAVPTFMMGALPTYAQIGVFAPVLLVLLRLLQGLAVAGEMGTSVTFLVEQAGGRRRGIVGSAAMMSAAGGTLAGSAVGALLTTVLSSESIHAWGWRIPFLIGLGISAIALYLRRTISDNAAPAKKSFSPWRESLTTQWRMMLRLIGMNAVGSIGFYLCFVFSTTYLRQTVHMPASISLDINTLAVAIQMGMFPIAAALSDKVGRRPVLLAAATALLVLALPLFWLMHHLNPIFAAAGQCLFAALIGCFVGVAPTYMAEMLPRNLRCTTLSLAYNVGFGVLGGLTPLAALWFMHLDANPLSAAYLLMAAAVVSLLVVVRLPETAHVET
ncbi:general substrate transporter [Caballeronia fortuita]|uniref:General substrate transporter n=1 Tax=Caballeronia fortuita TaxID=1777138 RepID=A0A158CWF9_9BURK|nr:MFS transporter [Caballeronia fortuita]SAK86480.1 general substrate transporter [Caballeronia fortuita]